MRFPRVSREQSPPHSCKPKFQGGRPKRTRKNCIDAMRHPVICFTQVFSRIVRANHEKNLPRVLHIQILWRFDFRNRKTVLEISQHLLSCFTQPFFQNGRAVREKTSRASSIFRFFLQMISNPRKYFAFVQAGLAPATKSLRLFRFIVIFVLPLPFVFEFTSTIEAMACLSPDRLPVTYAFEIWSPCGQRIAKKVCHEQEARNNGCPVTYAFVNWRPFG